MTPEQAAICLRDDPTFATSPPGEQAAEAALLLGTDDPLDIAMAVELALKAPKPVSVITGPGDEGCRLEAPCANPRLAGNGRCMDCGANRVASEIAPQEAVRRLSIADAVKSGPRKPRPPSDLRRGVAYDPAASLLGRFKEATGATDHELADMLGVSRSSVQAYIAGRRTELLNKPQVKALTDQLAEHLLLTATLKRDLAIAIGEFEPD